MRQTPEARAEKRRFRKSEYEQYLKSSTWKKIRATIILRDKHCQSCGSFEQLVVHHARYPKVLGQENPAWLVTLCDACHDGLHRLMQEKRLTLRAATNLVLGRAESDLTQPSPDSSLHPISKKKKSPPQQKRRRKRGKPRKPLAVGKIALLARGRTNKRELLVPVGEMVIDGKAYRVSYLR